MQRAIAIKARGANICFHGERFLVVLHPGSHSTRIIRFCSGWFHCHCPDEFPFPKVLWRAGNISVDMSVIRGSRRELMFGKCAFRSRYKDHISSVVMTSLNSRG